MLANLKPSRVVAFVAALVITAFMAYGVLYGASNFVGIMARAWKKASIPPVTDVFLVPPAE